MSNPQFLELGTQVFVDAFHKTKFTPIEADFYFRSKKHGICGCALTALSYSSDEVIDISVEKSVTTMLNELCEEYDMLDTEMSFFYFGFDSPNLSEETLDEDQRKYFVFGREVRKAVDERFTVVSC